jgi:hypothetical protein
MTHDHNFEYGRLTLAGQGPNAGIYQGCSDLDLTSTTTRRPTVDPLRSAADKRFVLIPSAEERGLTHSARLCHMVLNLVGLQGK